MRRTSPERESMSNGGSASGARRGMLHSKSIAISLCIVVATIASLAVVADGWRKHASRLSISVTGTSLLSASEILRLAAIPDTAVLADIDLMAIRQRIEKNQVVREALLRRNPPATLEIEIRERLPIALLVNVRGKDWLIDEDGYILPGAPDGAVHAVPIMTLDQTLAEASPGTQVRNPKVRQALRLLRLARVADSVFLNLFSEISVTNGNDIVLYTLEAGVPVIFGATTDIEQKIMAFRAYWENVAAAHDVSGLEYIDLRFSDQVVVRWMNTAEAPAQPTMPDPTGMLPD